MKRLYDIHGGSEPQMGLDLGNGLCSFIPTQPPASYRGLAGITGSFGQAKTKRMAYLLRLRKELDEEIRETVNTNERNVPLVEDPF